MNVLIYTNVYLWEQHLSETLEIIQSHLESRDNVYLFGCDKTLISCPPNHAHESSICKSCNIQKKYLINELLNNQVKEVKLELENKQYIGTNFKNLNSFLKYKYKNFLPVGELSLSTHTDFTRDFYVNFKKIKNKLISLANNAVALYERSIKVIEDYEIDVVYSWNGRRHSDGPVLYAAKYLNKKYFSYLSGGTSKTYMKQPTLGIHDLNFAKKRIKYLFARNKRKLSHYIKEGKLFFNYMRYGGNQSFGMIYFKDFFNNKITFKKKSNKKNLVIFTSSYWEFYSLGEEFRVKNGIKINHYNYLEKILSDRRIYNHYDIYIRWHPHTSTAGDKEKEKIKKIIKKYKVATHFDYNNRINTYMLMKNADKVVSFGSTTGCEATFYGKISILLGPAYYEDIKCVYEPKNYKDFLNLLFNKNLKPLPKINAIKYAYHERHKGEFNFKYLNHDTFYRWYYKGQRVKKFANLLGILKEKIIILVTILKLKKYYNLILNVKNKFLNINTYKPLDW